MSTPSRYKVRPDIDRRKSLQELEESDWGDPPDSASYLVTTVHNLRRKPVGEFTAEDLRIVSGQGLSLPVLMPIMLERLEQNPLVSGHFGPGDLLDNVVCINWHFWKDNLELMRVVSAILERAIIPPPNLEELDFHERWDTDRGLERAALLYEAWREWYYE